MEHHELAAKHGLDLELEATSFRGFYEGKRAASWNGRFTTWLARQAKWSRDRGLRKGNGRSSIQDHGGDPTTGATVLE